MKTLLVVISLAMEANATGWLPLAPVQVPRQEMPAVAVNGRLYVLGGIASDGSILTTVEQYDPVTNQWQLVASMPRPRHHMAAVTIGDFIYIVGGYETL